MYRDILRDIEGIWADGSSVKEAGRRCDDILDTIDTFRDPGRPREYRLLMQLRARALDTYNAHCPAVCQG